MKLTRSIKKTFFVGASLFLLGNSAFAQDNTTAFATKNNSNLSTLSVISSATKEIQDTDMAISPWEKRIGITGAFGEGATSTTLGFSHLYGFGSSRRFKLGYGVRLSSFFGSDRKFTAAPPDLASQDDPQYFSVGQPFFGNNDTESKSQINAINLGLYTEYSITEKVLIGFNIDVVGFSFGAKKDGSVYDETSLGGLTIINDTSAKPTSFNALLIGDNDRGTLNSEFWIGYRIASNVLVRGAFSYLFTEYTTNEQYQDGNDRFRYKAAQGAVGVNYVF